MTKLRVLVVSLVLILGHCEEWFEPDSHLISEAEHAALIQNPTTFKLVKYFTPNCMYCRYLKMVIDKIKHEKEWCFTMYDFNCQWYPQFCFQTIHAPSFPYTLIYNPEGAIDEVISGFYPEPVMRTIFDRLQAKCLQHKASAQPEQTENPPSSLTTHEEAQPDQPVPSELPAEQAAPENNQNPTQSPAQTPVSPSIEPSGESHTEKVEKKEASAQPTNSTFNYIFYGACGIISAIYIHHVHNAQDSNNQSYPTQVEVPTSTSRKEQPKVDEKVQQVQYRQEQKQMLASLSDDQL